MVVLCGECGGRGVKKKKSVQKWQLGRVECHTPGINVVKFPMPSLSKRNRVELCCDACGMSSRRGNHETKENKGKPGSPKANLTVTACNQVASPPRNPSQTKDPDPMQ